MTCYNSKKHLQPFFITIRLIYEKATSIDLCEMIFLLSFLKYSITYYTT